MLQVSGLCVRFRRAPPLVSGIDFSLGAGRMLALVGASGVGKSVTARALLGLLPSGAQLSGSVRLRGQELVGLPERELRRFRGAGIALALQDAARGLHPMRRIGVQIAEAVALRSSELHATREPLADGTLPAPRRHGTPHVNGANGVNGVSGTGSACITSSLRLSKAGRMETAARLCEALGLEDIVRCLHAYPHELSGGMRQRAMLAMALAPEPDVLILDEATAPLDPVTTLRAVELVRSECRRGLAAILISHDISLVGAVADDVLELAAGDRQAAGSHSSRAGPPTSRSASLRGLRPFAPSKDRRDAGGAPAVAAPACRARADENRRNGEPLLRVRRLRVAYSHRNVLDGVSFDLHRSETLAIVGTSGCGKSTLARAVARLEPARGEVRYCGTNLVALRGAPLRRARRDIQMVFQDPWASLDPHWRVAAIVSEGLHTRRGEPLRGRARQAAVHAALDLVALPAARFARRRACELSGGECQRVALARALVARPDVLILDEATASLDGRAAATVTAALEALRLELGLGMLLITHDLNLVARCSDRIAVLHQGRVCETGATDAVLAAPSHAWTAELIAASRRFASLPHGSRGSDATN